MILKIIYAKLLMKCGIFDKAKSTIFKYLIYSFIKNIKNPKNFI